MNWSSVRLVAALSVAAALSSLPSGSLVTAQNQTPARPAGNQSGEAPANQTPAKPAEPPPVPGTPLYISPAVVQMIQQKLIGLGYPMPTTSGAWGENSAAGLAQFQKKEGLDPGGDLDELTLLALGLPEVLTGNIPAGASGTVSDSAAASGGAPLSASPRLTRVVQNKLTEAGFPPHNVFGIWIAAVDNAPRNFQKARGLDITNTLDLQMIHALGLTESLTHPKPGKLPTDAVAQILTDQNLLLTGAPLSVSAFGLRQVQTALAQRGYREVKADGKWSDDLSKVVKTFQESQKLEPTGSLNLRTLRALGFENPLADLDRPPAAKSGS